MLPRAWIVALVLIAAALGASWWYRQNQPPSADGDQFPYVAAARTGLATKFNVPRSDIDVVSISAKDWPDSSLGCPEEGKVYAQVITPGYLVVLEHNGQWYTYHTDQMNAAVTC